jgi:hypothetical protein
MSRVIVDDQTSARLSKARSSLDLCDSNGHILGRFTPIPEHLREPQVSEDELKRREASGGGRQLSEILADLEKRQ